MSKEILQFVMWPILWWFETISSLGSQSLGLAWVCWLQEKVVPGPSVCFIFQVTKLGNMLLFLAGEFNIPVGMLKFVLGLLVAFPMALLIRMIPCTFSSWKHFVGAISGLCVLQFVFGSDWLHPVVSSFGTYLLLFFIPRKHLPMAVTLWSLGYLVLSYIYRMYVFYNMDLFDFTRCQMVMTMKFMQLGYNLHDGYIYHTGSTNATVQWETNDGGDRRKGENGHRSDSSNSSSSNSSSDSSSSSSSSSAVKSSHGSSVRQQDYLNNMHHQRRLYAIVHPPGLLPYCGYVFGVTGLLAGPALEYNDYIRAMNGSIYRQNIPTSSTTTTATTAPVMAIASQDTNNIKHNITPTIATTTPSTSVPISSSALFFSSLGACLHRISVALICLLLYFRLASKCPISRHRDVYWQTHTPAWWRLVYIWVSFLGERCKFYFVWKLSEASCILAGLGFVWTKEDTQTEKETHNHNNNNNNNHHHDLDGSLSSPAWHWRGASGVDILAVETAPNMSSLTRAWNQRVQHWLEGYVYQRTQRSLLATYLVSALWHGLYPGYVLFFLVAAGMGQIERLVRVKINPWVIQTPPSLQSTSSSRTTTTATTIAATANTIATATTTTRTTSLSSLKTLSSSKSLNSLVGALTGIPLFETSISTATVTERIYYVICWMVTSMTLMYFIQTFYLKTWDRCYLAFASFSFLPHLLMIIVHGVLMVMPVKTTKTKME